MESRIPLTISYDWNPKSTKSTDKAQNPVPGIWIHSVESRIQEYLGSPYIGWPFSGYFLKKKKWGKLEGFKDSLLDCFGY